MKLTGGHMCRADFFDIFESCRECGDHAVGLGCLYHDILQILIARAKLIADFSPKQQVGELWLLLVDGHQKVGDTLAGDNASC